MEAIQALDRAASKGVLHRNNAGRRKSRLAKQLSRLRLAPPAVETGKAGRGKKAPVAAAAKPAAKAAAKTVAPAPSKKK
jgi:hypothetical protein